MTMAPRVREEVREHCQDGWAFRARLLGELAQLREKRDKMCREVDYISGRCKRTRRTFAERLSAEALEHRSLRARLDDEHRKGQAVKTRVAQCASSHWTLAKLNRQIAEVGVDQAALVNKLRGATSSHALLHDELQTERLKTWHESAAVMLAFARNRVGSTDNSRAVVSGTEFQVAIAADHHRHIALGEAGKREADALRQRLHDSHIRRGHCDATVNEAQRCLAVERIEADGLRARLAEECKQLETFVRLHNEVFSEEAALRNAEAVHTAAKRGMRIEVCRRLEELQCLKRENQRQSRRLVASRGCCLRRS
jgi:hypothetical protein